MELIDVLPENYQRVLSKNTEATLAKTEQTGIYIEFQEQISRLFDQIYMYIRTIRNHIF